MELGKVYLVGAGPGHPDLLTLKALQLIREADVIVYDRLVQEEVLDYGRADAERIYVGKAPGRHESRQDEINELLATAARRARVVVRLKGGDPLLFSRGGEEAEFLAARGVPVDVIPGVSSALAAPAAAGIPITHRDVGSTVCIITGHERDDGPTNRIDWAAVARMDTLIVLMGVRRLPHIAACLMAHGLSGATPAALVQMAFWADEQAVVATLETIAQAARDAGVRPPATLVVGRTVAVRERLRTLQRDLQRHPRPAVDAGPGPAPEEVLRVARASGVAAVVRAAIACRLFDRLENEPRPDALAAQLGLPAADVTRTLEALAAERLVRRTELGYRNSEAASRYLVTTSRRYLGASLLRAPAGESHLERLAARLRVAAPAPEPTVGAAPAGPAPAAVTPASPARDYPVNLRLAGRPVLVVGGGEVARRKVERLLRAGAALRLVSPTLDHALRALVAGGRVEVHERPFRPADADGMFLVFVATDDGAANDEIAAAARAAGALVNAADEPVQCDFTLPACVERGDLLVAISSGGQSPALSGLVRRRLEAVLGPEYGRLLAWLGPTRRRLLAAGVPAAELSRRVTAVVDAGVLDLLARDADDQARALLCDHGLTPEL